MTLQKEFWESLGIPINDIIEKEKELGDKISKRLANKLTFLSEDFGPFVKEYYKVEGDTMHDLTSNLYLTSKDNFIELNALALFADKRISPDIINSTASNVLSPEIAERIVQGTVDSTALLLPLFKLNPNLLYQIYYEHLCQCKSFRRFKSNPELSSEIPFSKIDNKEIDKILKDFEKTRRRNLQRPIKAWWFDTKDGKCRIIFRREKRASSEIKLVKKTIFARKGDEKIFIFSGTGNVLEMCSREPIRTLKIAEFLINKLTGLTITYKEVLFNYKTDRLDEFMKRLLSDEIENLTLIGIKTKNVPLPNSPTLEIGCQSSITSAVNTLQQKHGLPITSNSADILNLRIQFDEREYTLRVNALGDTIELLSDNRNIPAEEKGKLGLLLEKEIGQ
ncbi:MAG: hypothetical protein ABSB71_12685 [Candidatus Bathyarchaeia archaeon]